MCIYIYINTHTPTLCTLYTLYCRGACRGACRRLQRGIFRSDEESKASTYHLCGLREKSSHRIAHAIQTPIFTASNMHSSTEWLIYSVV